jgi:hypothetical protein
MTLWGSFGEPGSQQILKNNMLSSLFCRTCNENMIRIHIVSNRMVYSIDCFQAPGMLLLFWLSIALLHQGLMALGTRIYTYGHET